MNRLIPAKIDMPPMRSGDPRIGHLLGTDLALTDDPSSFAEANPAVVIVGFPCDIGVLRNGGRPGAAMAPQAIRERFYALTPDPRDSRHTEIIRRTLDLGNVELANESGSDLRAAQQSLANAISPWLERGCVVIVLGGGHETAYGHFLGYVNNKTDVGIVNIDAHGDVREMIEIGGAERGHSGSPFRQAAEHPSGLLWRYDVFGLQPYSLAGTHLDYLNKVKGKHRFADDTHLADLKKAYQRKCKILASFCLDAVDQSQAPGVSAPATHGLGAAQWLKAAETAGRSKRVKSMDIVELSPPFDRDQQTARLAALTLWHFLRGVSQRD